MNNSSHENRMDKYTIRIVVFIAVVSYWVVESALHKFIFADNHFDLIPTDANELWMRGLVVAIIILFGGYVEYHMRRVGEKEKEKTDIYMAMLRSSNHILNNFLNQMQIMKIEAEQCQDFNKDILAAYDIIASEASELIRNLEKIPSLTKEDIWATVASR